MLMLHSGGIDATYDEVASVHCPAPKGRWYPISHKTMIDTVKNAIRTTGLKIENERYGLMGQGGERFFGTFAIKDPGALPQNGKPIYQMMLGLRGSIDKSMAAGLCFGSKVFVCDNMAFSGEVTFNRKHTSGIMRALPRLAEEAVKKYPAYLDHQNRLYKRMMEIDPSGEQSRMTWDAAGSRIITPTKLQDSVDLMLMRAYRSGAIPASGIGRVLDFWDEPKQRDFYPRTAWSLYNAFTEYMKQMQATNPEEAASRTIRLTGLFHAAYMN